MGSFVVHLVAVIIFNLYGIYTTLDSGLSVYVSVCPGEIPSTLTY